MTIRLFSGSDAARCADIIQACVDEMPEFDTPTKEYLRAKNTAAGFAADARRMWIVVVDEQSGLVAGVGALEQGEMTRLYVHPKYQKRGIGTGILRHLEEAARKQGLTTLAVRSSEHARPFYLSHGYAPIGTRKGGVGPATFHWIDMVKQVFVRT